MTGTGEESGKGEAPKEDRTCEWNLGHVVKNYMTVIAKMGGYQKRRKSKAGPLFVGFFYLFYKSRRKKNVYFYRSRSCYRYTI